MLQLRPRAPIVPWFRTLTVALLTLVLAPLAARADEATVRELPIRKALVPAGAIGGGNFSTANSNCAGTACDTVWVGHTNSGPGGNFLGVGIGGVWDFDSGVAGTDSSQGWTRWVHRFHFSATRAVSARPEWYYDYGNMVNEGNTALWAARDLAGRAYVKTGIAGAWHADDMVGVKKNINDGAEATSLPIAGSRSAWCGLRESGNTHAQDALTGNYINGDLYADIGPPYTANLNEPEFPGYCNQWDQMIYKDFTSSGTGTLAWKVRVDMTNFLDTAVNGSGWYNPDPTTFANYVHQPADSFMVYVGSPNDLAYDTNRRWFSEVLDLSKPVQELFSVSNHFPFTSPDTSLSRPYAGLTPVGGKVRVVFRVKTNRIRADSGTATATGFQSKDGAALIDDVSLDGGTVYGFETVGSVTARSLIPDIAANNGAWATTGRPPAEFPHIENVGNLIYEDLCGAVGASTRQCNLVGNVIVAGDFDNSDKVQIEGWQSMQSPTVNLAVRSAAPGTKNTQGIDQQTASRSTGVINYDIYSGFMSLDESVFWFEAVRGYGSGIFAQPVSGAPTWSTFFFPPFINNNPVPQCFNITTSLATLGMPVGSLDSLKIGISFQTAGYRFGGTNLGNTRGTYADNLRLGLVRAPAAITWDMWQRFQDQFPFNEAVPPGDNAGFDTTTALMTTGLNIVVPQEAPGDVPGDSIAPNMPYLGNGVTTGTRLDLVFRIDPGPGNYTVKGDRTSPLVNKDPAHPFFAAYLANNGTFGTPGGHGARWNRDVWNSARMDSGEANLYYIGIRNLGGPNPPAWMGTLHEQDPKFAALGITHNICFLVNQAGPVDMTNTDCSGTPPASYATAANGGFPVATTKEGTKILPDGWFTPGTHIEYFVRASSLENPGTFSMLPDTNIAFVQDPGGTPSFDVERWSNANVLPDLWKSTRFGGLGLACMLMVDGADRRGADPQYRGAADTLGYGKLNGAAQGWKVNVPTKATGQPYDGGVPAGSNPNNTANFVAANGGQYGLNYDHFNINEAEGSEAGHPGSRFASNTGFISLKRDFAGPSAAQLNTFYSNLLYLSADLDDGTGTLQDGITLGQGGDDITLLDAFLNAASNSDRKSVWLSGDGIMQDAVGRLDPTLFNFVTNDFGSDLAQPNYKAASLSVRQTVGFLPTASWAHPGRVYGFNHSCLIRADELSVIPTVSGATEAAQYENLGPAPWTASVYRPVDPGTREFRTLIDGFDLSNLRSDYASLADVPTKPEADNGRLAWFDDVWAAHFQLCARRGPVVSVGDLPGGEGGRFTNAILGTFPNPALANQRVTLRFTLAQAKNVTIRIYSVAGREVASFRHEGTEGPNNVVWNGALSNGAKATPGVYFYRIDGVKFDGAHAAQKMILLSSN
jgi:hypothetical protein